MIQNDRPGVVPVPRLEDDDRRDGEHPERTQENRQRRARTFCPVGGSDAGIDFFLQAFEFVAQVDRGLVTTFGVLGQGPAEDAARELDYTPNWMEDLLFGVGEEIVEDILENDLIGDETADDLLDDYEDHVEHWVEEIFGDY